MSVLCSIGIPSITMKKKTCNALQYMTIPFSITQSLILSTIYVEIAYRIFLSLQQIQIKKAGYICHRYKFLMTLKKNPKPIWNEEHEKNLLKLPKKVAKAARHLCRKMLRYKGISQKSCFNQIMCVWFFSH